MQMKILTGFVCGDLVPIQNIQKLLVDVQFVCFLRQIAFLEYSGRYKFVDIFGSGLADSRGLSLATAAYTAYEKIGLPECAINLSHVTVFLALTPKSNSAYLGWNEARDLVAKGNVQSVPNALQQTPSIDGNFIAQNRLHLIFRLQALKHTQHKRFVIPRFFIGNVLQTFFRENSMLYRI